MFASSSKIVLLVSIAVVATIALAFTSPFESTAPELDNQSSRSIASRPDDDRLQERDPRVRDLYSDQLNRKESASSPKAQTRATPSSEETADREGSSYEISRATSTVSVPTPTSPPSPPSARMPGREQGDSITDPLIAALQDLSSRTGDLSGNGGDRFNPGVRSNGGAGLLPTPAPTPTPSGTLPWVTGQSTGFASLAFMHPRARPLAEAQIQTLLDARLRNVFLGVLVDGTFEIDEPFLRSAIERLTVDGRRLTLLLYLSNGPTMRRYDVTPITAAFARVSPDFFRFAIRFEPQIQQRFSTIAARWVGVADLIRSRGSENRLLVVPSLEDNLDRESYRAIRELTRSAFGDRATIVRNICPGCWPGNDTDSLGDPIEAHTFELLETLGPSDGFTLDGIGYRYSDELNDLDQVPPERVRTIKETAIARRLSYFGLWRKQRQGLGTQLVHPDSRSYEVPTPTQIDTDIELLRHGLPEERSP